MITLNTIEKDFLNDMINLSERTNEMFLGNLVDKYLENIDVNLNYNRKIDEYQFDQQFYPNTTDFIYKVRELSWTFMKFVKLLQYFEEKNYLYLYQESNPQPITRFGRLIRGHVPISYRLYDPEITRLLLEYSNRTIVLIGNTLKEYVANDFKTQEQLQHEENIRIAERNIEIANHSLDKAEIGLTQSKKSIKRATGAIFVSIILGLISIGASFYIANQQAKNETKINSEQFDQLRKQFNLLTKDLTSIDSIMRIPIIPDTINTRIINEFKFQKIDDSKSKKVKKN